MAMRVGAVLSFATAVSAGPAPPPPPAASGYTCGDLKEHYAAEECCGMPNKVLSKAPTTGTCPYSFFKPMCEAAEPQSPRDLSSSAPEGMMVPKASPLTVEQREFLPLVNVHFHLGAEHKSDAYADDTDAKAYDGGADRRLASNPRPGFMCDTTSLDVSTPYTFQYCKGDVAVGKSYEVHYVHSSAGYSAAQLEAADIDGIEDGLGGAANGRGLLNPMVAVQGQVYVIANDGENLTEMVDGWTVSKPYSNSVMYMGSTTGPSHNNEVCSPYTITWHVDKACHAVTPEAFDNMCKKMKNVYDLEADLYPHGSRKILDAKWVVASEYVAALA